MNVDIPNHVAITMGGNAVYAKQQGISVSELYKTMFNRVNNLVKIQTELNIPILTLYLLTSKVRESQNFGAITDNLVEFFEGLENSDVISENKVKITVIGKWYDMPGRVVEPIKKVIDGTKDYDSFFLNICINYNGREEIVDACKLIGRKIKAGKLDPELIDQGTIKDCLYSSYFLQPDILIKTGPDKKLNGFLLWDTTQSHIYLSGKLWPEFEKDDLSNAISQWNAVRKAAEEWKKKK